MDEYSSRSGHSTPGIHPPQPMPPHNITSSQPQQQQQQQQPQYHTPQHLPSLPSLSGSHSQYPLYSQSASTPPSNLGLHASASSNGAPNPGMPSLAPHQQHSVKPLQPSTSAPYMMPASGYATTQSSLLASTAAYSHPASLATALPPGVLPPHYATQHFMAQPGAMMGHPEQEPIHVVGQQGRRGVLPTHPGRPAPAIGKTVLNLTKNAQGKFDCPHCTKNYLHLKHLKRHLLRHTGERPYQCHLCKDTFSRSDILKRHFQKCSLRRGNPTGAGHLQHSQNHLRKGRLSVASHADINYMAGVPTTTAYGDYLNHTATAMQPYPSDPTAYQNGLSNGIPNGVSNGHPSGMPNSGRSSRANSLIRPVDGAGNEHRRSISGMDLAAQRMGYDSQQDFRPPTSMPGGTNFNFNAPVTAPAHGALDQKPGAPSNANAGLYHMNGGGPDGEWYQKM